MYNSTSSLRKISRPASTGLCVLTALIFGFATEKTSHAASLTWDTNSTNGIVNSGPGTWTTATTGAGSTQWLGSNTNQPWVNGDDAVFGINPSSVTVTGGENLILGTNVTVNNIFTQNDNRIGAPNINNTAGNTFVLTVTGSLAGGDGNGFTFGNNLDVAFTNGLINTGTTTIGGTTVTGGMNYTISGSANITGNIISAQGGLILTGTVASTGVSNIIITGGSVDMSNGKNYASLLLGNVSLSGGTLKISGTGTATFPALSGTFGMTGGTLDVNGVYSGTIGTGINQLQMTGNDTLSGGGASGTFNFNVGGASPGGMLVYGVTTGFNPTQLTLGVAGGSGVNLQNGLDINTAATRAIILGANGTSLVIMSGSVIDSNGGATNGVNGSGNVGFQSGNGVTAGGLWINLTGTDTYTGTTFVGGTNTTTGNNNPVRLVVGSGTGNASFASSNVVFSGTKGGQFEVNVTGTTTISANIVTATGTDTTSSLTSFSGANNTVIIGQTITQNGVAAGVGTVIFTGNNTYVGGTLLQSGTLQIGNGGAAGSLPSTSAITGGANTALVYDLSTNNTLSGTIQGAMGLTQMGSGLLTITGTNATYTGATTISSGTLQLGNGVSGSDASLSSATTINNQSALVFNTFGSGTIASQITGSGSVSMIGVGNELVSGGGNNYTGVTSVTSGTLQVGSASALGNTSNLIVGGAGTVNFFDGSAQEDIGLNQLTLSNGATLVFSVGNNTADEVDITNNAVVSGIINIKLILSGTGVTSFTILDTPGGFNGATFQLAGSPPSLTTETLVQTDTTITITVAGVTQVFYNGPTNGTGTFVTPGSPGSNWTSDEAGTQGLGGVMYSSGQNIYIGSDNVNGTAPGGVLTLTLGGAVSGASLNFFAGETDAVVIAADTNTLTLFANSGSTGINAQAGAGPVTIGANVTFATGAIANITANNASIAISGTIAGSSGLLVNGTGLVTLTGTNTYSGGTTIAGDILNIQSDLNLGATGAGNGVALSSGTLQLASSTVTLNTNRIFNLIGGGNTIDTNGANTLATTGGFSGSGNLNLIGGGTLLITGSDSNTGLINITSGTVQVGTGGASGSLGSGSVQTSANTALVVNLSGTTILGNSIAGSGTLVDNGPAGNRVEITGIENISNYIVNSGTMSWESSATLFGNAVNPVGSVTINAGATLINNKGDAIGGSSSASPSVILTINSGTFIQNNSITNFGIVNLNGGTIITQAGNSGQFPSLSFRGNVTVAGSAESFINTTIPTSSNGNIRLSGSNSATSDITTFNVGVTGAPGGIDLSVNANLEDGWAFGTQNIVNTTFIKAGNGTMQLSGTGQWGGGTQINGGILQVNSASALPTAAIVAAGAGTTQSGTLGPISFGGGTLQYTANNQVDYSGNFSTAAGQLFSIDTNGQNVTYATGLASTGGSLTKLGAGILTLNGNNTYDGATNVLGGELAVNGSLSASTSLTVGGAGSSGTPILGGGATASNGGTLTSPTYTLGSLSLQVYTSAGPIGNIQGAVTINGSGPGVVGTLAPGNSVGTLTLGSLTMNAGSIANYEFNGSANDFTAVTGALSLTGVGFNLYIEGGTTQFDNAGTYALFSYGSTGSISGLTILNPNAGFNYVFNNDTTDKLITLTITAIGGGGNTSTLTITPNPISVGNVLVGHTATGSGTLTNTDVSSNANYTVNTTGSVAVTPVSGSNLTPGSTQVLSVTGTAGSVSGSGTSLGTVSATNTSNNPGGNASAVNVTANVYDAAAVTSVSSGQFLQNTGVGSNGGSSLIASAKVQSNTINVASTQNASAWTASTPTIAAGGSSSVESFNSAGRLNGTYQGTATISVGNVATDGSAISGASAGDVLTSSNYAFSATVSGNVSTGSSNIFSAQILSGSSYIGYSLNSGVVSTPHTATGAGGKTQAILSYGTATATTNVNMSFDNTPAGGNPDNPFRTSDILTLTGIHATGSTGPSGSTLTDKFVLQLSYDNTVSTQEYIAQNQGGIAGWVNAVVFNSSGGLGTSVGNESYAAYLAGTAGGNTPALGTYGYSGGIAWAVLDHTTVNGISEFAVIPEPSTYAMIFGGFGMLIAFRRLRRRSMA